MRERTFVDKITLYARSGKGGAGCVHFRREKYKAKGGPDGGHGGQGGHVIAEANPQLNTLLHLAYAPHVFAQNGDPGGPNQQKGKMGMSKKIPVPLGTLFREMPEKKIIAEVTRPGQEEKLLLGGKGGLGNAAFASATRQTPYYAQPGEPGEEKTFLVELKLLADVGLLGAPNAGKSTLLSVLTGANPRIASYPFTTLYPSLGVVSWETKNWDRNSFVMADLPGILPGASEGRGLGPRFLQHVERNRILLLMIAAWKEDLEGEYHQLIRELEAYNSQILQKPRVIVLSQTDLLSQEQFKKIRTWKAPRLDDPVCCVSSHNQEGLNMLKQTIWCRLNP
ncbi:MAG: GTPase ObgE [Cytophagales bacterium]|nr:GTPase ObgE [Cytophagales bacterium]